VRSDAVAGGAAAAAAGDSTQALSGIQLNTEYVEMFLPLQNGDDLAYWNSGLGDLYLGEMESYERRN
jgi:hypothetical protein